jgi:hypothetical protein
MPKEESTTKSLCYCGAFALGGSFWGAVMGGLLGGGFFGAAGVKPGAETGAFLGATMGATAATDCCGCTKEQLPTCCNDKPPTNAISM